MNRVLHSTFFLIVAIALFGCATPPPLKLDFSTEQRLTAADCVKVCISDEDKKRLDELTLVFGHKTRQLIETGPVWARAFIGNLGEDPVFRITRAELRDSIAGLGFTARFTYIIDGELSYRNHVYPIHAEGSRAAATFILQAMQQAVELGIAATTKQVKQVMASPL